MDTLLPVVRGERHSPPLADATSRPRTEGKFLCVNNRRFWVRGVTYGTFTGNSRGELLPEPDQVARDFQAMVAAGVNTVRTYTCPPRWFMDLAAKHGLMVIAATFWEARQCLYEDEAAIREVEEGVAADALSLAGHPALLMICLGNEIPPLVARWHGKERVEALLKRLRDRIKSIDPEILVTYANYPPTEFLDLSFLDVIGFNVYLEKEPEFRAYLARLQMLAGDRPLFISELGLDSLRNGADRQAEVLEWQLRSVWEKGLAGVTVYAWTDEWAVAGKSIDDWDFGLVDRERRSKPALEAVRWNYRQSRYDLRTTPWPRVSVVCCAYNAEATLAETLESLIALNYPDYEVIVIDDGSRDRTAAIAEQYPCRLIRVENGGLSRARNLGIDAAAGEIVAFIDSDAAADPDWLYFLVTQIERVGAVGCGGPNLPPPADPEAAHQVARSPGNAVHVLLDDETAEHIPGCNMAFRKDVLLETGGFNPVYRVAGDDVDVCWKVLERGHRIAFSPAALVWHHRRSTHAAYLRQQRGYGIAEALLECRYPERYGLMGGASWRGRVYDGPQPAAPWRIPGARDRVYHGPQANGLFQSVYTPHAPWWFNLATAPEFYGLSGAFAASATWSALAGMSLWPLLSLLALGGLAVSLGTCLGAARRMCRRDELPPAAKRARTWQVAKLHFLQPWVRWWSRLQADRRCRTETPWPARPEGNLWAGWDRRDEWLHRLTQLLRDSGMQVKPGDEWGEYDLHIQAHPGYTARLQTVVEHQTQIRFRSRVSTTPGLMAVQALVLSLMALLFLAPPLLPLALPLSVFFTTLRKEKRRLEAALAVMGTKAGEVLGMVPLAEAEKGER